MTSPTGRAPSAGTLPVPTATSAPATGTRAGPAAVWAALVIVYLVWGSTYLAIRITVEALPSLLSAAARFAAAAAILAVILLVRGGRRALAVRRRQAGAATLVGVLLLAGGNGLVVLAESGPPGRALPSGVTALFVAGVPLVVVLLRAATGDRPRWATIAGVAVGFGGLVLLVLPTGESGVIPLTGALTVAAAAVSWALGSFLSGRMDMPDNPFVATVYEMLAGAVVLGVIGVGRGELHHFDVTAVPVRSWSGLAYLVVAGSLIAFTAYAWLLQRAPISLVSTYAYVNPAVAVALGAMLLAEPVTIRILIGGAVIVLGVALVVGTERPGQSSRS